MQRKLLMNINKKVNRLLFNVGDMALKRRASKIVNGLNLKKRSSLLEVGCGDGYYLYLLSHLVKGVSLVGLDSNPVALQSARKVLPKKIKLIWGNAERKLPFKDRSFDNIILSEVLEHLDDEEKCLKEIYRVLKPGGTLMISVPHRHYPFFWDPVSWILQLFNKQITSGFFAGIWNQHKRLYTPQQLKMLLDKVKFKIDYMESITWWCLPFNHYLVNIGARLLYGNKLPQSISAKISKFQTNLYKPTPISSIFKIVNLIDKLNDYIPIKESGVGIIVKVKK